MHPFFPPALRTLFHFIVDRIPVVARFPALVKNGLGAHSALYTMGTVSFPGVKRPGRGVNYLLSSSAEVKERVELCLYSPSVPFICVAVLRNISICSILNCRSTSYVVSSFNVYFSRVLSIWGLSLYRGCCIHNTLPYLSSVFHLGGLVRVSFREVIGFGEIEFATTSASHFYVQGFDPWVLYWRWIEPQDIQLKKIDKMIFMCSLPCVH
jgi:hypothetical protein